MGSAWKYWQHVRLDERGCPQTRTVALAKAFFDQLSDLDQEAADGLIQRRLVTIMRSVPPQELTAGWTGELGDDLDSVPNSETSGETSGEIGSPVPSPDLAIDPSPNLSAAQLAACCLRCFVSHLIPQICAELEQQFRQQGVTREILYAAVMEDLDPTRFCFSREPLAARIVRQFDPVQSSLTTWTRRLTRQHKALNQVLEEDYGVYLASDWAILLRAKPEQIQRSFTGWAVAEVQASCLVLRAFHAVYRSDRLTHRLQAGGSAGRRCSPPTSDQLNRMVQYLKQTGWHPVDSAMAEEAASEPANQLANSQSANSQPVNQPVNQLANQLANSQSAAWETVSLLVPLTSSGVLKKLQTLAQALRRISVRATVPLDALSNSYLLDQAATASEADRCAEQEQDGFLLDYRRAAQTCLQQAVDQAIERRLNYFRSRASTQAKADDFLRAMLLFHNQFWSMSQIAPAVGLTQQFQVSRLLGLKELQADFYQIWLLLICQNLPGLLQEVLEPEQIRQIEQHLAAFLLALHAYLADKAQSRQKHSKPGAWRDQLRQLCDAFPLVAALSGLIEEDLKAYATETYSPARAQPSPPAARSLLSICICRSLSRKTEGLALPLASLPAVD